MTPTDLGGDVSVRLATVDDAEALADLYSDARRAAVPQMPPAMHTDEEHRGYYARQFAQADVTVWVAESDAGPLGHAICTPTFLEGLYVRSDLKGQGIGSLLLDVVEATHPRGLRAVGLREQHRRAAPLRAAWPGRGRAHRRVRERGEVAGPPDGLAPLTGGRRTSGDRGPDHPARGM